MHQRMGNLFYQKQSTAVIGNMGYGEMKYWNTWHEIIQQQYEDEANNMKNKGRK